MKFATMTIITSLINLSAFAQPISLKPGSSIVISGNEVSCEGPSDDALVPACSIRQNGSFYQLIVEEKIVESFYTFNAAVEGAKKMKEAGLCR